MKHPRSTEKLSHTERLLEHGWSIMLYDGNCELCSRAVGVIEPRSRRSLLAFCAIQSEAGRRTLAALGRHPETHESVLVLAGDTVFERGDAVLQLMEHMPRPWSTLAALFERIPKRLRDGLYGVIARNRYRLFGRRCACMLSAPHAVRRFMR